MPVTRDEGFIQLETRFNETTKMADRLRAEAQAFRDGVSGKLFSPGALYLVRNTQANAHIIALLTHQAEMASFLSVIYSQHLGVEVEEGGVQRRVQPTPAAASQAANDAEAAMAYCRDEILPQLVSASVGETGLKKKELTLATIRTRWISLSFAHRLNYKKSSKPSKRPSSRETTSSLITIAIVLHSRN